MAIIGFNLNKISAQKIKTNMVLGKVNINNNLALTEVKGLEVNLGSKDNEGLLIRFEYSCKYDPDVGLIAMEGEVVSVENHETVKRCIETWNKTKILEKSVMHPVMAYILNKCTIQAIIMSRDVGLPVPVPMPKLENAPENDAPKQAPKQTKK